MSGIGPSGVGTSSVISRRTKAPLAAAARPDLGVRLDAADGEDPFDASLLGWTPEGGGVGVFDDPHASLPLDPLQKLRRARITSFEFIVGDPLERIERAHVLLIASGREGEHSHEHHRPSHALG